MNTYSVYIRYDDNSDDAVHGVVSYKFSEDQSWLILEKSGEKLLYALWKIKRIRAVENLEASNEKARS